MIMNNYLINKYSNDKVDNVNTVDKVDKVNKLDKENEVCYQGRQHMKNWLNCRISLPEIDESSSANRDKYI